MCFFYKYKSCVIYLIIHNTTHFRTCILTKVGKVGRAASTRQNQLKNGAGRQTSSPKKVGRGTTHLTRQKKKRVEVAG